MAEVVRFENFASSETSSGVHARGGRFSLWLADLNADARSEAYNERQKKAIEREFFKK